MVPSSQQWILPAHPGKALKVCVCRVHGGAVAGSDRGDLCVGGQVGTRALRLQPFHGAQDIRFLKHKKIGYGSLQPTAHVIGSFADRHRMTKGTPTGSNSEKRKKDHAAQTDRFAF